MARSYRTGKSKPIFARTSKDACHSSRWSIRNGERSCDSSWIESHGSPSFSRLFADDRDGPGIISPYREPASCWSLSGQRSSISRPRAGSRGFPIPTDCEIRGVARHSRRRRSDARPPNDLRGHWEEDAETTTHEITSRGSVRRQPWIEEESQAVRWRVSSSSRRSPMFQIFSGRCCLPSR